MNTAASYQNNAVKEDFTVKERIAYTLLTGLFVGACIHFGGKLIKSKKEEKSDAKSFEAGTAATIAKQIKMAFENDGMPGTDTKKLRYIFTHLRSKDELDKIAKEYQNQFHSLLFQDLKKELQSSEYDEMLQIKEGKPQKAGQKVPGEVIYKAWAKRLKAAFDKTYGMIPGTDEDNIKTVFQEIPTRRSFVNVAVAYYKEYKTDLLATLKSELEAWEYPTYLMMITNKPQA